MSRKDRCLIEVRRQYPHLAYAEAKVIAKAKWEDVKRLRAQLYYEQAGHCGDCGNWIPKRLATFEHIIPYSLGGPETWGNGLMLCRRCNHRKGNNVPKDLSTRKMRPLQDFACVA